MQKFLLRITDVWETKIIGAFPPICNCLEYTAHAKKLLQEYLRTRGLFWNKLFYRSYFKKSRCKIHTVQYFFFKILLLARLVTETISSSI